MFAFPGACVVISTSFIYSVTFVHGADLIRAFGALRTLVGYTTVYLFISCVFAVQ
ncbi:hypothetical protein C8J57DRAFT_703633 [Mycena rebaudengoi]|nr:hypothetical protein C8J57DRAFT_703633 [Mycena rebaudengoi]